ncbi:MAG: hypothetical protein RSB62_10990 [Bacteroides sp.]
MKSKIIAVDFDGTLCVNKWPEIGRPIHLILNYIKKEKEAGCKIILWTCRSGERLAEAVEWCEKHGLLFDAVNQNLPEVVSEFGGDTRKIVADKYIDDKNFDVFKCYSTRRPTFMPQTRVFIRR